MTTKQSLNLNAEAQKERLHDFSVPIFFQMKIYVLQDFLFENNKTSKIQ